MGSIDKLLDIAKNGNESEAYKAMQELNSSALHEMTKDPHQVIKYSRILRQIQHLVGNDSYSFLSEAGRLCGYVEAFEAITKNRRQNDTRNLNCHYHVYHARCIIHYHQLGDNT